MFTGPDKWTSGDFKGPQPIDALLPDSSSVEDLLSVVYKHLSNPDLMVEDLADKMTLSRRQLTRRMKQATGESPLIYYVSIE